jgi:hypothetical protein
MGENIFIRPSNSISRTVDRIPFIDFINEASDAPLRMRIYDYTIGGGPAIWGQVINFSASTSANILTLNAYLATLSATSINVINNLTVGSTQVINDTANWIGSQAGKTMSSCL